jgi:hypothetical protein
MFLNHQTYEDLNQLVGPEATLKIAKRYGSMALYFPKLKDGGNARGPRLVNGLRFPEVRSFICQMRRHGATGIEIQASIQAEWPQNPEKWISKSALSRFFISVRNGRMREFGIDDMFREIGDGHY